MDMDGTFPQMRMGALIWTVSSLFGFLQGKGIYFAVASRSGISVSRKIILVDVRDDIIFIAENGSLVEYQGQDLYEATMSREFYLSTFEKLKTSPM